MAIGWIYTESIEIIRQREIMMRQSITKQSVIDLLQQNGIQSTQQRIKIGQSLFEKAQHLSADQVLAQVNHNGNSVSKATVYNTLGLFARKGLLREIIVDPNRVFYDTNTTEHHHFYNIDTGELSDFSHNGVEISEMPALPEGTEADSVDIIFKVRNTA